MFIKNVCAIALAVCISVSAFAKISPQNNESEIDFPCVIVVNDTVSVNARAVTEMSLVTGEGFMVVVWSFGKDFVFVRVKDRDDAMNLAEWYNSEVERKCK